MSVLWVVLALVAVQRIVELAYARRNTERLLARGGVEAGAELYPWIVLVHAGWLGAMAAFIAPRTPPNWWLLGVFAVLQGLRVWTIASLGPYWTTRVIRVAGDPLVRRGPYRVLRHPNYAIVAAEIAVLPLAFGSISIAIAFSILNAAVLARRIQTENAILATPGPRTPRIRF